MRDDADQRGVDLLVVDTGDRVDGNGLYDGSDPKGRYSYDIFKEQHIDIICTGNHELYEADAAEREYNLTVPNFAGAYLASNLDILHPETGERVPLSRRYRQFTTKNQGIRVLAFGFLFDFDRGAKNTFVQKVRDTIEEPWFQAAIREKVDIFVVVGHVTPRSEEYMALYTAIRRQNWDTPIQFFGGHSHVRDYTSFDSKAHALQSGRYMETIGWMAIDGIKPSSSDANVASGLAFERRYIDNNLFGYHHHTGLNESTFPTELGQNVSEAIRTARKAMNLDERYGCAPQDYWLNRAPYTSKDSIFRLLTDEVLPGILVPEGRADKPRIAIVNTGGLRFDIFKGTFTKDTTLIISPFNNRFKYIKDVPWRVARRVLPLINAGGQVFDIADLQSWALAPPQQMSLKKDIIIDNDVDGKPRDSAQAPLRSKPSLVPGYTTQDDGGDDGDDTVHDPLSFYRVPNCVQAEVAFPAQGEPETVDLVFLDFVEPWILLALKFSGRSYGPEDVGSYMDGKTFTGMLKEWVSEHWSSDC